MLYNKKVCHHDIAHPNNDEMLKNWMLCLEHFSKSMEACGGRFSLRLEAFKLAGGERLLSLESFLSFKFPVI